jgi:hypothetical protein
LGSISECIASADASPLPLIALTAQFLSGLVTLHPFEVTGAATTGTPVVPRRTQPRREGAESEPFASHLP